MEHRFPPILFVLLAAALAPIVGAAMRRVGFSIVVIELLLGILVGPQGLGLVGPSESILPALAKLGMAFLFFIAGLEIDLPSIRGRPLTFAFSGWIGGLGLAVVFAFGLRAAGLAQAWPVVAIALATTALGVLVPILRDANATDTDFGRNVLASGVMGELGPILVMSIVVSRRYSAGTQMGLTLGFVVVVLGLAWMLARGVKVPALLGPLRRGLDHSGQLPIRLLLLLIVVLAVLAENAGLDLALGALAAGMMVGFATRGGERVHDLHAKVDAVGFGFLVPVFFLVSGMKLDVRSIVAGPAGAVLLGLFFVALLLVRIPAIWLLRAPLGARHAGAVVLFSATTLPLVVVLTQVAVDAGVMPAAEAAPMVGAGMLTVIAFPALGLRLAGIKSGAVSDTGARDGL
jgi:Kef-type K+ transport system membrane component KefB